MPGTRPGMTEVARGKCTVSLKLFELVGTDETRPFSPFRWRTRMVLAHKGLAADAIPWRFTEKEAIARREPRHDGVMLSRLDLRGHGIQPPVMLCSGHGRTYCSCLLYTSPSPRDS